MIFSKYIYRQDSQNKDYIILFNTKNAHSIMYNSVNYPKESDMLENESIKDYLIQKEFLVTDHKSEEDNLYITYDENVDNGETLALTIFVHGNCNFRCTYCYEEFEDKELSFDQQKTIIDFVKNKIENENITLLTVSWFGGEPLLGIKDIEYISNELIKLTNLYNIGYVASITTNGFLLTERIIDKLLKLKVTSFQVTIDGNEDIHNKQRKHITGQDTYKRIYNNLINMKSFKENFSVIIRVNVSNENYPLMDNFLDQLIFDFKDDDRFKVNFHSVMDFKEELTETITKNITLELMKSYILKGGNMQPILGLIMPQSVCYASKKNNYSFGIHGEIFKCTVALYDNINIIGKYGKNSVYIDHKKELPWLSKSREDKCCNCILKPMCWGNNCPLYRLRFNDSRCLYFKNNFSDIIDLLELQDLIEVKID